MPYLRRFTYKIIKETKNKTKLSEFQTKVCFVFLYNFPLKSQLGAHSVVIIYDSWRTRGMIDNNIKSSFGKSCDYGRSFN